jgi:hypothetical protein
VAGVTCIALALGGCAAHGADGANGGPKTSATTTPTATSSPSQTAAPHPVHYVTGPITHPVGTCFDLDQSNDDPTQSGSLAAREVIKTRVSCDSPHTVQVTAVSTHAPRGVTAQTSNGSSLLIPWLSFCTGSTAFVASQQVGLRPLRFEQLEFYIPAGTPDVSGPNQLWCATALSPAEQIPGTVTSWETLTASARGMVTLDNIADYAVCLHWDPFQFQACNAPSTDSVAVADVSGGTAKTYPGDEAVQRVADQECPSAVRPYLLPGASAGNGDYLGPTPSAWNEGVGQQYLECVIPFKSWNQKAAAPTTTS